jgi:hypothetical protein
MDRRGNPEIFTAMVCINPLKASCEIAAIDDDIGRRYVLRVPVTVAGRESLGLTEAAFGELFRAARDQLEGKWPRP